MKRLFRRTFGARSVAESDLWEQFDRTFAEFDRTFTEADKLFEMASAVPTAHGCVCPVGAEKTCQGPLCPRRPIGPATS